LHLAAGNGHASVVKELLDAGASFDLPVKVRTRPPESVLATCCFIDRDSHFNGDVARQRGWSALMLAALKGHGSVVKLLLAVGGDKDSQNLVRTASHAAYLKHE
jgi:ankyrin repeat protein